MNTVQLQFYLSIIETPAERDRFSRNRYDSAHYRHQLKRCGVSIRSVVENLDDTPESIISPHPNAV